MHTVFNNRVFVIIIVQLWDIPGRLVSKVLFVLLNILLGIMIARHRMRSIYRDLMCRDRRYRPGSGSRKPHNSESFHQCAPIHLSLAHVIDHFRNGILLFLHTRASH